ncbi:MAG: SIR2 family protein, partial [Candidatus Thorarchaeota archaeon SMTZ1-45]
MKSSVDRYAEWNRKITREYAHFEITDELEDLIECLGTGPICLLFGAGMSTVSSEFMDEWTVHGGPKTLNENAEFKKMTDGIFRLGGVYAHPREGMGFLPDLVNCGFVKLLTVFNYDCQVETCLHLCNVRYQSKSYAGDNQIETISFRKQKVTILKPHGSYRLLGDTEDVVLPGATPSNQHLFKEFEALIQKECIKKVLIIGYSGNWDPHVEHYLKSLKKENCEIYQVDLSNRDPNRLATVRWKILARPPFSLDGGGNSALYALAKKHSLRKPCWQDGNPALRLIKNIQSLKFEYKIK